MPPYTMHPSLSASIQACQHLTKQAHSNFVPAFALLPKEKRQAMEILYAFNRYTDDIADANDNTACRLQKLNHWANALEDALQGRAGKEGTSHSGEILLPALKMIVDKYDIPREPFFQLIDGMRTDIGSKTFATFEDSLVYCDQVAGSVGIASLAIWGTSKPLQSEEVRNAARACGVAFQWTNIVRDLREDWQNGRVYLPQSDLLFFNLSTEQFGAVLDSLEGPDERFCKLLAAQLERCKDYYEKSLPLFELISSDSRRTFGLMWDYYYLLYRKMASNPLLVIEGRRVRLSACQKLRLWLRWRLFPIAGFRRGDG